MDYLKHTEAYLTPPSQGGEDIPTNKVILTTLEARAKQNDTWEEWEIRKQKLVTYLDVPIKKEKLSIIKPHRYTKFVHNLVWEVDNIWARQFKNFDKLTLLVKRINKQMRKDMDTEHFKSYIEKFYRDEEFTNLYNYFVFTGKDKWYSPSLDHIIPVSKGGSQIALDNIQWMTWFENNLKESTPNDEWLEVRKVLLLKPEIYLQGKLK